MAIEIPKEFFTLLSQHRKEAFDTLFHKLDDAACTYAVSIFASLTLSDDEIEHLRSLQTSHSIAKRRAIAILTMKASETEVLTFLQSPDNEIRNAAYDYLGYRSDLAQLRKDLRASPPSTPILPIFLLTASSWRTTSWLPS